MLNIAQNIVSVYLDTAFWLLLGLVFAGLVKAYLADGLVRRWLGGAGIKSVLKATLLGAPLPLCSCGVLPAAVGLRRAGASKEATVAFLIATPETGVDSVSVSYALLGPFMALARLGAALVTAVVTGWVVAVACSRDDTRENHTNESACDHCHADAQITLHHQRRLIPAMRYAFTQLLDDLSLWLFVGIVVAGLMLTFIPPDRLSHWSSGLTVMLLMLLIGIPMYICAVASTPVAAAMLVAGLSPGAVLVFMLAGPATNIASLGIVKRELGMQVLLIYLTGIAVCSVGLGLLLDWAYARLALDINMQMHSAHGIPALLKWLSGVLLLAAAIRPLRRRMIG